MKKMRSFIVLLSFVAFLGFITTSCDDSAKNPPTITVSAVNANYYVGQPLAITFTLGANDADLETIAIDVTGAAAAQLSDLTSQPADAFNADVNTSPFEFESGFSSVNVTFNVDLTTAGTVEIHVVVTDKDGQTATEHVEFTVAAPVAFSLELGDQASATGSFGASSTGQVFSLGQVTANYALIDMIYYYDGGTSFYDALYSPDDSDIHDLWSTGIDWTAWQPKNPTRFVYINYAYDFDTATYQDIVDASDNATDSKAYYLAVGDIYGFTTINNMKGILRINTLSPTAGGTMTFDVKMVE